MKLTKNLLIAYLAIGGMLFSQTSGPKPLSLNDAIGSALQNNEVIKAGKAKVEQAKYNEMDAWGNFLPDIQLSGSYNHLNDPIQISLDPVRQVILNLQAKNQTEFTNIYSIIQKGKPLTDAERAATFQGSLSALNGAIPKFEMEVKKQDFKQASFTAVQPIFMGGKLWAAKNYAQDEVKSSESELRKTKSEIVKEVASYYITCVLLNDVVKTRIAVLEGMNRHKTQATKAFNAGLANKADILRAEVAVAEADNNLFSDKNRLKVALIALKNAMGVSQETEFAISDSLSFNDLGVDVDFYQQKSEREQPIFNLLEAKKDAAKQNTKVQISNFLPTVAAFGKYELYPEYLSMLDPRWVVGVSASFNIFNGFQDYARLQKALYLEKEVDYMAQDAHNKISLLIRKSSADIQNSREGYAKTNRVIDLANENLRTAEKKFETGLGTSLEVVDAELLLEKNKIESKNYLYQYYSSYIDLLYATGRPEEITEIWNKTR